MTILCFADVDTHIQCTSAFENVIWHIIGPKCFLFGTAQFSLGQMVQLVMIIYSLLMAQDVFYDAHLVEPTWTHTLALFTGNLKNPFGNMCLVFLLEPYPTLGIFLAPLNFLLTLLSIPLGLRQLG